MATKFVVMQGTGRASSTPQSRFFVFFNGRLSLVNRAIWIHSPRNWELALVIMHFDAEIAEIRRLPFSALFALSAVHFLLNFPIRVH